MPLVPENRRLLPHVERSLHDVDPALLRVFIGLADGRLAWPLLLWGPPGRGKTCAALALCDVAETAAFWTAEDLATFVLRREAAEVDGEYRHLGGKALTVLDELGTRERVGDLAYSTVKRFADVREQQAGRVAIYVSNVPPHELSSLYDDRLASRLLCGTVFELTGADRRKAGC